MLEDKLECGWAEKARQRRLRAVIVVSGFSGEAFKLAGFANSRNKQIDLHSSFANFFFCSISTRKFEVYSMFDSAVFWRLHSTVELISIDLLLLIFGNTDDFKLATDVLASTSPSRASPGISIVIAARIHWIKGRQGLSEHSILTRSLGSQICGWQLLAILT